MKRSVEYYVDSAGEKPFIKWFEKLDKRSRVVLIRYIDRLAAGSSSKNIKNLKDGVFELRIFYGPGYRVYFAYTDGLMILLFLGGDKSSQGKDIALAKKYWVNYAKKK